jgi:Holliday junction resolvase
MSEQTIQSAIIKWLEKEGFYVIKTITCNKAGVPDIIACAPGGLFVAIEVKTPTGRVSKLQEVHVRKINNAGGIAFIARSLPEVKLRLSPCLPLPTKQGSQ